MARFLWLTILALSAGCFFAPATAASQAGNQRIAILYSAHSSYRTAADALRLEISSRGYTVDYIELPPKADDDENAAALGRLKAAKPAVVAAVGPIATTLALDAMATTPIVFVVVPNTVDMPFAPELNQKPGRLAGVSSDISPAEQAAWIRTCDSSLRSLAVLHTDRTMDTAKAIARACNAESITALTLPATKDEFPKAIDKLNESGCDGVLMIPDAKLYNSATVQRLLLWGIRNKKPIWTFSSNIAKAGAFAAQYPDYEAMGRQAADIVHRCAVGADPSEIGLHYPDFVTRAVNERTADLLGLPFPEKTGVANVVRLGSGESQRARKALDRSP